MSSRRVVRMVACCLVDCQAIQGRTGQCLLWSLLLASLLVVGCDGDRNSALDDELQGANDGNALFSLTALSDLAARKSGDAVSGPMVFPGDLGPHPEADAESLSLRTVLSADDGELIEVQVQLDRLALNRKAGETSAWEYSDIMRSSVMVGGSGELEPRRHQSVQRRALGLANSDSEGMSVIGTRINRRLPDGGEAADSEADSCRSSDFRLTTILPAMTSMQEAPENRSAGRGGSSSTVRLSGQRLELRLDMSECPDRLEVGNLRQWTARAMPVTASITNWRALSASDSDGYGALPVWHGRAWLSHSWGALPASAGAVIIDTVELYLDSSTSDGAAQGRLSVTRSKRRSGRGPETVQGSLSESSESVQSVDLQWIDSQTRPFSPEGQELPEFIQINSIKDESIRLQLTPLLPPSMQRDIDGIRWRGAVTVSGSHRGVGFVDYQPLQRNSQPGAGR